MLYYVHGCQPTSGSVLNLWCDVIYTKLISFLVLLCTSHPYIYPNVFLLVGIFKVMVIMLVGTLTVNNQHTLALSSNQAIFMIQGRNGLYTIGKPFKVVCHLYDKSIQRIGPACEDT